MTPRIRAILDDIDALLGEGSEESHEIWYILAALRGPDYEAKNTMEYIGMPLRRAAFPRALPDAYIDEPYNPEIRVHYLPSHYVDHLKRGYAALGMAWDKKNERA